MPDKDSTTQPKNPLLDAQREAQEASTPYFECRKCENQGICPIVTGRPLAVIPEHPEKCWIKQIAMHPDGHRLLLSIVEQVTNEAGMLEVRKMHLARVINFLQGHLETGGRIVQANLGALPPMGGRRRQ